MATKLAIVSEQSWPSSRLGFGLMFPILKKQERDLGAHRGRAIPDGKAVVVEDQARTSRFAFYCSPIMV